MQVRMAGPVLALALALAAAPVASEPVDSNSARKLLFSANGHAVQVVEGNGLSPAQLALVRLLVKNPQFNDTARYYGAMALSPSLFDLVAAEGISSRAQALVRFTGNHHSPAAAAAAAQADCNRARRRGDAPCVTVVHVLPKRWKPRALMLSQAATARFAAFRKTKAPKAFAASAASWAFGLAQGEGAAAAALAACNANAAKSGAADCDLVISD